MQTLIVRQSPASADSGAMAAIETLARDAIKPWSDAFDSWRGGVETMLKRATKPKDACGCGCESDCQPDECQCSCCVADSDLVVEARVGERRVIPIIIENKWRRVREVEVQLSDWSCADDRVSLTGKILDPVKFTIDPCDEHKLMLLIEIAGNGRDTPATGASNRVPTNDVDVDRCVVCYADLRIKGCDVRPVRIAVAVLPCDCGAYRVDCCQACC